jgi:hypothetical protein
VPSDVVDDILAAPRRRALLNCLAANDGELVIDALIECVRDRENTTTATRQQVRTNLYQDHLPKLTATGIVTYDSMRDGVTLTAPAVLERLDG